MKVLLIGSGGREHALAWKLSQEAEVFAAPGNPGIAEVAECFEADPKDHASVVALARHAAADLVVVGPEAPLIGGLADSLRADGIAVFGPGRDGARLEGSKAFSKSLMAEAGVPTAEFKTFSDPSDASEFARKSYGAGVALAVKASGQALGKGVAVCGTVDEALDAIDAMMVRRELGDAGAEVVLEERLVGREFSLLTLCSGTSFHSLPVAQDYKRAFDADRGPNTGGMGSFSPVPLVTDAIVEQTERSVVAPLLALLTAKGIDYRGVLFSGLMLVNGEPKCLEYNVRFGDPETQSVLPLLGDGFAQSLLEIARGGSARAVPVRDEATVTVVVARGAYPDSSPDRLPVRIENPKDPDVWVFQAGTKRVDGNLMTAGGRVASVTARGPAVHLARAKAYQNLRCVRFDDARWRADIAERAGAQGAGRSERKASTTA